MALGFMQFIKFYNGLFDFFLFVLGANFARKITKVTKEEGHWNLFSKDEEVAPVAKPEAEKAKEEAARNQHYAGGAEYAAYAKALKDHPALWCEWSEKYINWRQLEILGLMSKGSWA